MNISKKERIMMANELMAAWIVHHGSSGEGQGAYAYSAKNAALSSLEAVDALIRASKGFMWYDHEYK